jgi:transposase
MHGQGSRLLGLTGLVVMDVGDVGDQLDLQVELIARAASCPRCGRGSVTVKERPVVAVRDLPIGGRPAVLWWRKRRYRCARCARTFTETHPELPSRQRVTERFRRRLRDRVTGGGAHAEIARDEQTTRYQVTRAFRSAADEGNAGRQGASLPRRLSFDEAHHRRGRELATVVSDLDRRCVVDVVDGCTRRAIERYLRSLSHKQRQSVELVSIDPLRLTVRRSDTNSRTRGSSAITSTSSAARTPHWTPSAANANANRPGGARRAPAAAGAWTPGTPSSTAPDTGS